VGSTFTVYSGLEDFGAMRIWAEKFPLIPIKDEI